MSYPIENALFQWEEGYRALQSFRDDPATRRRAERVVAAIGEELRRRVGITFNSAELAELYGRGTDWCESVAAEADPHFEGEATALIDAAFWLYLRGATDFAGGRRLPA